MRVKFDRGPDARLEALLLRRALEWLVSDCKAQVEGDYSDAQLVGTDVCRIDEDILAVAERMLEQLGERGKA